MTKSGSKRISLLPALTTSTSSNSSSGNSSTNNSGSAINGHHGNGNGDSRSQGNGPISMVLSNPTTPTGLTAEANGNLQHLEERPDLLKKLSTTFLHEAIPERFFYDELSGEEEKQQLKNRLSKAAFNFHQAAYELYITEQDFVGDMQVMNEVFIEPMEKQFPKDLDLVKSIFTEYFSQLTSLHVALLQSIKSLREGPFTKHGLGELFLKNAILFQSYSPYFINYPTALLVIEKKKEKEAFRTFVRTCEQSPLCRKLKIQSLLIKPIQRVMKYPLLLRELAKSCEDEAEKAILEKAHIRLQEVVATLNEVQRKAENREKVEEIRSRFHDKKSVNFLIPNPENNDTDSRFYLEAKVSEIGRDKQEEDQLLLFLFHDNLLLAKKHKGFAKSSSLRFLKSWPLGAIVVNDYENQEALAEALEIGLADNASQRYWFHFGPKKAKWLSTFNELGVRRNVDLRRAGSIANFATILDEEENWEELFKTEQLKVEQLEEQVQNWEERCQELEKNHKEEREAMAQRTEAEKAASQSQFAQELKSLRAQATKSEAEVDLIRLLLEKQAAAALQEQEKRRILEAELQAKSEELRRVVVQADEDKKKRANKLEADLEAQFASAKKEHEAQRKLTKTLEANIHQLSEQNQDLKKQLEAAAGDRQEVADRLATAEKSLGVAQAELQAALEREAVGQEELKKSARLLASSQAEAARLAEDIQQPLDELQKATEDLSTSRSREAELSEKIEELTHRLEETTLNGEASVQSLHEELVRLDGVEATLKAELALSQSSLEDIKGELESARATAADEGTRLAHELALSKSLAASVLKEKEDLLARVEAAEKQVAQTTEEKAKIAAALNAAREEVILLRSTQQSSVTETRGRLREAELGHARTESQLKTTQETAASLESKLSAREAQNRQLEGEIAQIRALLQAALGTQEDLRREAALVHQRHRHEAETATNQILSLGAVGEDLRRQLAERGAEQSKKKRSMEAQLWMAATIMLAGLLVGFLGLHGTA